LAECLYDAAKKNLKDKKLRTDYLDKDSDIESNFYVLKHTLCPAVLTENFF
jgi:N-acetylmuramoyl-L-alanine amidase